MNQTNRWAGSVFRESALIEALQTSRKNCRLPEREGYKCSLINADKMSVKEPKVKNTRGLKNAHSKL